MTPSKFHLRMQRRDHTGNATRSCHVIALDTAAAARKSPLGRRSWSLAAKAIDNAARLRLDYPERMRLP